MNTRDVRLGFNIRNSQPCPECPSWGKIGPKRAGYVFSRGLSLVCLYTFWDNNPPLFATRPEMDLRSQPTGIVQGSWFDGDCSPAPFRFVVNPGPAIWTECTKLFSTRIRFRHEGFRFAVCNPKGCFVDHHCHSKCATGLSLAVHAVADDDLPGLANHFVSDRTALTPAGYRHSFLPSGSSLIQASRH